MRINGLTYAFFGAALVSMIAANACSATGGSGQFTPSGSGGSTNSAGTDGLGGLNLGSGGSNAEIDPPCDFKLPSGDHDGDGFTVADGDCNDCSGAMNPGAQDFADNHIDEDCDGAGDNNPTACDGALSVTSNSALDGAKALGLCKTARERPGASSARST